MDCDPGPVVVNPPAGRGRGDRLSRLDDGVLGHILSFLPSPEAGRTALLSRRWRHVLPAVHSLSFDESDRPVPPWEDYSDSWSPSGWGQPEVDPTYVPSQPFVNRVSAAIHGRHRGAHAAAPLRALRVAFREWKDGDARSATAVDGWLAYAAHQAAGDDGELHVDLRFGDEPLCHSAYALRRDGEEDAPRVYPTGCAAMPHAYAVPSYLLRCAALRSLRVGPCRLNPPATVSLPSLHTLQLIRVIDGDAAVKLLLSGCPRLADLTLEACNNVTKLSVRRGTRLRRLALRCCHGLATVAADVSELRAFEYRGPVPPPTFRRATKPKHRPSKITSCEIDFCGEEASHPENVASLRDLFHLLSGATHLQLKSARLGAVFSTSPALPVFATLRELELTGILTDDDTAIIGTITRVLEHTPSLEILSLFFMPEPRPEKRRTGCRKEEKLNEHWLKYDRYAAVDVPEEIPRCLRKRTKEINLVHYQGLLAQRMLAKFLLHKAPIVHEVCCEFAKGPLTMQTQLMEEIRGWVTNKSANMMFF